MRIPSLLITLLLTLTLGNSSLAQQGTEGSPLPDNDFQVQGEYSGLVRDGLLMRRAGLQVIAQGNGQFEAVVYLGGLPGNGWNLQPPVSLKGSPEGDQLLLSNEEWHVQLANGRSARISYGRQSMGQIHKVQRASNTIAARPPRAAVVLFDGQQADQLEGARISEDGLLMEGVTTQMPVGDFQLHIEFRIPYMPTARGQGRGNSGVYIQRRYEVQILDSFGLAGTNNECGGLYKQRSPELNMCLPPLAWQTYDMIFRAARWDGDKKTANAHITVLHNGVAIHDQQEIVNKTGAGQPESPEPLPIHLQNHGNPVRFRNIWIVTDEAALERARSRGRIVQRRAVR
jgi:hypothetical protein